MRDMLFGASALSPAGVWVVGDQEGADGRFQTLTEHWNGRRWRVVRFPLSASASVMLDGVVATHGQVWVAGEADSPGQGGRPLIEHYRNGKWHVVHLPSSVGSDWTSLWGIAEAGGSVWAVASFGQRGSTTMAAASFRSSNTDRGAGRGRKPGAAALSR